jgi:hypothetical protein
VQRLLVLALGDLEAVWADMQLKPLLLGLPLPAMQLLLSSRRLRVASEDTVLCTAQQNMRRQKRPQLKAAAKAALAQLVRAPHLSMFTLSLAALTDAGSNMLLSEYSSQLKSLLSTQLVAPAEALEDNEGPIEDAHASWRQRQRQIQPLPDGVRLEWRLPVEQLRQACRDSFARQEDIDIDSPHSSPPLCGLEWDLSVSVSQEGGGTVLGLCARALDVPSKLYYSFDASVGWEGFEGAMSGRCLVGDTMENFTTNPFDLQPMTDGGWDEAAWAAKGLSTQGQMRLWLHVN